MKKMLGVIFALAMVCVFTASANADLSEGLVAYYPFNGNADDESGNVNHGTVQGAILTDDRLGNPESAYFFDGIDDSIIVPDSPDFDMATTVTFSAWANPYSVLIGGRGHTIFRKVVGGYEDKQLRINDTEEASFYVWGATHPSLYAGEGTTPLNTWTHIAATYNGSIAKIYINGVLMNSMSASGDVGDSYSKLYIGGDPDHPPYERWLHGAIDEIRIYNRVLSDEEISDLSCTPIMPENCTNGFDDDCDGLADGEDDDCGGYSGTANAEASTYGGRSLTASGTFNALALLLIPVGGVIALRIWRRKK